MLHFHSRLEFHSYFFFSIVHEHFFPIQLNSNALNRNFRAISSASCEGKSEGKCVISLTVGLILHLVTQRKLLSQGLPSSIPSHQNLNGLARLELRGMKWPVDAQPCGLTVDAPASAVICQPSPTCVRALPSVERPCKIVVPCAPSWCAGGETALKPPFTSYRRDEARYLVVVGMLHWLRCDRRVANDW